MDEDSYAPLVLGRYGLLRRLARGGMGTLYLARTEGAAGFKKPVVVKLLHPHLMEERSAVKAFIKEAKLAAQLVHPCIVQVLDFGEQESQYVMVLEYVHGYDGSLLARHMVATGHLLSVNEALFTVYQMLRGLEYAHGLRDRTTGAPLGIVHCDISPHNLLLSAEGQVKLADFGIARLASEKSRSQSDSGSGGIAGKLLYLAPEQVSGGKVDHRTDLYAAGLVLYEFLSGQRPFAADTEAQILLLVAKGDVPDVREYRPEISAGVAGVLRRALAPSPQERFQNAGEFLADIRREMVGTSPDEVEPSFARTMAARFCEPSWTTLGGALPDIAHELAGQTHGLAALGHAPSVSFRLPRARDRSRRLNPLLALVAALAAAVLGFTLLTWTSAENPTENPLTVVIDNRPDPLAEMVGATPVPAGRADGAGPAQAGTSRAGAYAPDQPAEALPPLTGAEVTRQLFRHRSALSRCFLRHPSPGARNLALVLEIHGSGRVHQVTVEPAEQQDSRLARCLTRVATGSSFRSHPAHSALFRVPLSVGDY